MDPSGAPARDRPARRQLDGGPRAPPAPKGTIEKLRILPLISVYSIGRSPIGNYSNHGQDSKFLNSSKCPLFITLMNHTTALVQHERLRIHRGCPVPSNPSAARTARALTSPMGPSYAPHEPHGPLLRPSRALMSPHEPLPRPSRALMSLSHAPHEPHAPLLRPSRAPKGPSYAPHEPPRAPLTPLTSPHGPLLRPSRAPWAPCASPTGVPRMSPTSPQRPFRASSSMSPPGPVRSTRVARAPSDGD